MHPPAMDSYSCALTTVWQATTVLMPSKDRDIVVEVKKIGFERVGFDFSRAISK